MRYLEVEGPESGNPVLFVHGVPSSCEDWIPFLEALDGKRRCLAPDQIGLGASERAPSLTHTIDALTDHIERFLDATGSERFDVVAHDWGATGLLAAARRPDRVGRVVAVNTVPLDASYRWHWVARLWRRRGVGEFVNATTTRWSTRQLLRPAVLNTSARATLADQISQHLDGDTKRTILELYRDADPSKLGERGQALPRLEGPALVVWGDRDPYIASRFADRYGEVLDGRVEHLPQAGHWPWLDRPELVGRVADFFAS